MVMMLTRLPQYHQPIFIKKVFYTNVCPVPLSLMSDVCSQCFCLGRLDSRRNQRKNLLSAAALKNVSLNFVWEFNGDPLLESTM